MEKVPLTFASATHFLLVGALSVIAKLRESSFEALAPGAAPPPPRGPQLRHRRREPGGQLPRIRGLLAGQVPHPGGGQLLQQHARPRHHRDRGLRGRHVSGV